MSKKNITEKVKSEDGKSVQVTFENPDGHRVYEYRGSSMRAINRGKDPAGLTGGRLVEFKPNGEDIIHWQDRMSMIREFHLKSGDSAPGMVLLKQRGKK